MAARAQRDAAFVSSCRGRPERRSLARSCQTASPKRHWAFTLLHIPPGSAKRFSPSLLSRVSSGDRHDRRRRRPSHPWAAHFRRPRNRGSETLQSARSDRRKTRSRGILSHACGNLGSNRRAAAHLPLDRIRRRLSGRCVGRLTRRGQTKGRHMKIRASARAPAPPGWRGPARRRAPFRPSAPPAN